MANLTEQEADIVTKNVMTAVKFHVCSTKELEDRDVVVLENNGQKREAGIEHTNKRAKYDPLVEYRMLLLIVNQGRSQAI